MAGQRPPRPGAARVEADRVTAGGGRPQPRGTPSAVLPGGGTITTEPGGQLELSSAPATSLGGCVAAAGADLAALRDAVRRGGPAAVRRRPRPAPPAPPRP